MCTFTSLPEDVLRLILALSTPVTIRLCEQVCWSLRRIIRADIYLQYLLELDICGYTEPDNPRSGLSYSEKLEVVRRHKSRWDHPEKIVPDVYELHLGESSFMYAYKGGVYARAVRISSSSRVATRQLHFYQLPSSNRGTEYKNWIIHDLGVDIQNFMIDPEQDLLVLLEVNRAPGHQEVYRLHLRSMSTNDVHPKASSDCSVLVYRPLAALVPVNPLRYEVSGALLAVLFLARNERGSSYVVIWNWTTGAEFARVKAFSYHTSFTLLSEDSLAVLRCAEPYGARNNVPEGEFGFLDVFRFDPRGLDSTPPLHIASFALPVLSYPSRLESRVCFGSTPAPKASSGASSESFCNVFDMAPQHRILRLDVVTTRDPLDNLRIPVRTLCVPSTVILDALPSCQEHHIDHVIIPWVDWAEKTSWVDCNDLGNPFKRPGFGQRMAGFNRESLTTEPELVLLDFDQRRVNARAMSDARTVWELCTPGVNTPAGSNHELIQEAVFCSRTDLSRRRYMRAVIPVGREVDEVDKVMVDNERVVIEIGRRTGRVSLLVYTF
ncbi:hypothetical protein BDV93DRAFT_553553 [Ceratobasidium sp. AG-I]|nr:hypothetical protein BDV93DRAFT_553553 [Ceratobasidium sp. AG-I]